jgi:hypothetical protein
MAGSHTTITVVLLPCERDGTGVALTPAGCVLVGVEVGSRGKFKVCVLVGVAVLLSLGLAFGGEP